MPVPTSTLRSGPAPAQHRGGAAAPERPDGREAVGALRASVRQAAENRPGVYRFYGEDGELLYVGKSVRMRARLLSYFRAPPGEKAAEMVRQARAVDWEAIPNEFAALVREMKLIQKHRPRFNVRHKRRRAYAFVKLTREPAPRLLPVTRVVDDGATYYGPFPRVGALAHTVREIVHALGLRDCPGATSVFFDDQLELFGTARVPRCMRGDLGTCPAPCAGGTSAADYLRRVEAARRFLDGRAAAPLREMEARMREAAARADFEYAALLRDRLERLRTFRDRLVAFRGRVEDLSFVYEVCGFRGADRLYLLRGGRIRKELTRPRSPAARARVARAVEDVYGAPDRGPAALDPEEAAEILLVAAWFERNPAERERTTPPEAWGSVGQG